MNPCPLFLSLALAAVGLSGCAQYSPTLVFGTSDTLGLTIAGGAQEGGGEVTLGFKERNIAFSPVLGQPRTDGSVGAVLGANDPELGKDLRGASDTYSVFGSFALNTKNQNIKLGRFFSTGFAARELARGFACSEATTAYGERANTLDPTNCVNWRPAPPPRVIQAGTAEAATTQGGN